MLVAGVLLKAFGDPHQGVVLSERRDPQGGQLDLGEHATCSHQRNAGSIKGRVIVKGSRKGDCIRCCCLLFVPMAIVELVSQLSTKKLGLIPGVHTRAHADSYQGFVKWMYTLSLGRANLRRVGRFSGKSSSVGWVTAPRRSLPIRAANACPHQQDPQLT